MSAPTHEYRPPAEPPAVYKRDTGYGAAAASGARPSSASSASTDLVERDDGCFRSLVIWCCGHVCCCCCQREALSSDTSRGGACYAGCGCV